MSMISELGRTRLDTRRQRARRGAAVAMSLLGALLAVWIAAAVVSWLSGSGWQFPRLGLRAPVSAGSGGLLGLPTEENPQPAPARPQFPLTVSWPAPGWATALVAVPLWLGWARATVRPVLQGLRREPRHQGLASPGAIRRALGAGAARRAGRFTRPDLPWWRRLVLATSAFGFQLGYPIQPKERLLRLWATWEQRVRIIARTGWGKTSRLLVPIIRALPGPAVISSTEPAIFEQTVRARKTRRLRLRWRWLDLLARPWLPSTEYPVAVVDFSPSEARYAAGYPRVRWNLIDGCADFAIAHRRAVAQVAGAESEGENDRGSDTDQFFRDSASEVLAAWLHAADLGGYEVDDLAEWHRNPQDPRPARVLEDHPGADPSAAQALRTHLDPHAERTNSGVLRYLSLALRALTSTDGRALCGRRFDRAGNRIAGGFDMTAFIERGGTVYVLADPQRIDRARPLLSLFANEMFFAAEAAALRRRGAKRLPQPFMGILDELRYGVTVSSLPYIASAQRKYGIGYVYSVQSSTQEQAVYGQEAQALRDAAGVSLFGGIDIDSAQELADRAGTSPVVTATRGERFGDSEHVEQQAALTISDQQNLDDGASVVIARGTAPFLAYSPSIYESRRDKRQITSEAEDVAREVAAARAGQQARQRGYGAAGEAGAEFGKDDS